MASRNDNRNNFDDFSFDGNLDFDFDFDATPDERPKKDRKPVDHILEGVKTSLHTKFTDPSTYKQIARDALPEGLGKAWDATEELTSDASRLYDQSISEVKPQMAAIMRKIDKLVPDTAGRVKEISKKLAESLSGTRKTAYDDESEVDSGVGRMLEDVFGKMMVQNEEGRVEEEARRILDDRIDTKRFNTTFKVQQQMAGSINAIRDYQSTFGMNFQKKSLELQFRSYFAIASLVKSFNEYRKVDQQIGEGILKNTGLPEYAKIKETERFSQIAKEKAFGAVQDSLFGTADRIGVASKKIRDKIKEQMDEFKENISLVDDMLEGVISQNEMQKDMAEMMGQKHSGWNTAGQAVGTGIGEYAASKISKQLKKLAEKNPNIMRASMVAGRYGHNPGGLIDRIKRTDRWGEMGSSTGGEMVRNVLEGLMDIFGDQTPDMTIKNSRIGGAGEDSSYTSIRIARAQVDVIPGYLARILREITVLRTGDVNTALTVYDPSTGKFKTQRELTSDIMYGIKKAAAESGYAEKLDESYKDFTKGANVAPSDEAEVKTFLGKLARRRNFDFDGDRMQDSAEFRELTPSAQATVKKILQERYSGDSLEALTNKYSLTSRSSEMRGSIKDHRGVIQKAIADGHAEELVKAGFLKARENGDYDINEDEYYKLIDNGGLMKSDRNAKENIRPFSMKNGAQSLQGITNTPNYSWNYKGASGYGNSPHIGPMAQDVHRNLGPDAAPGGTSIDPISMQGHMLAAIKELNDKFNSAESNQVVEYLKSIDEGVKKMASGSIGGGLAMPGLPSVGGGSGKSGLQYNGNNVLGSLFAAVVNATTEGLSNMASTTKNIASWTGSNVIMPGARGAKNLVMGQKENAKDLMGSVLQSAISATRKAVDFGSDVLFNKTPAALRGAQAMLQKSKQLAVNMVNGPQDVYLPGNPVPVLRAKLMEMGAYTDSKTGKPITNLEDLARIKGAVTDHNDRVVLTIDDMVDGLFTQDGKPVRTITRQALDWLKKNSMEGLTRGKNVIGTMLNIGKSIGQRGMKFAKDRRAAAQAAYDKGMARGREMYGQGREWAEGAYADGREWASGMAGQAGEMYQEGRQKLGEYWGMTKEKASEFSSSIGESVAAAISKLPALQINTGCQCWTKPTEVLEQIRDLLALGKKGRRVKSILGRTSTETTEGRSSEEKSEDALPEANRSLLTQIRNAALVGKDSKVVESILGMGSRANEFLKDRTTGGQNANFIKKLTEMGKGMLGGAPGDDFVGPQRPGAEYYGPQQPLGAQIAAKYNQGVGGMLGGVASMLPGAGGLLGGVFNKAGGRLSKLGSAGKGFSRGLLGKAGGLLGGIGGGIASAAGALGSLFGGGQQGQEKGSPEAAGSMPEQTGVRGLLARARERGMKAYRGVTGKFNDRDGDGQRDGGAADRMQQLEDIRQSNEQRKEESKRSTEAGLEKNRYMDNPEIGGIFKMVTSMIGMVATTAGSIMSGAMSLLGMGGLGGLAKGALGKGGLLRKGAGLLGSGAMFLGKQALKLPGRALGAVRAIGTPLAAGASKLGGVARMLPGAATAARWGGLAARAAMAVGMASGGAGGLVIGALGAAASSVAAVLTSPVVLGAAAIGATAYGGYKLYKYLTRNKLDEWQRIRVIQYGLEGTDATEMYNSQVTGLEKYLLDGRIGYRGRTPFINERTIDSKEILELFSIDPKETKMVENLTTWIDRRFKPIFLHHLAVLANVDMKVKLEDLSKLKPEQQLEYLSKAAFESGPYDQTTSPFKGLNVLNSNAQPAFDLVNAKIKTLGLEQKKAVKEAIKAGDNEPKGADKKNAKAIVTSAADQIKKEGIPNMPENPPELKQVGKSNLPPAVKAFENGKPEDPPTAKTQNSTIITGNNGPESSSTGGMAKVPALAGGPLSDGSGGMKFVKLGKDAVLEGMHPRLLQHFLSMAQEYGEATGKSLQVNEAFRSYQRQAALYRQNPAKAAKPGNSMHEHGLALDVSSVQLEELEQMGLLRKYGFTRPVGGETWHIEAAGVQGSEKLAKTDKGFADMAIQTSLGRGGGGQGSIKGTKLGSRNPKLARDLYNASGGSSVSTSIGKNASPLNELKSPQVAAASSSGLSEGVKAAAEVSAGSSMGSKGRSPAGWTAAMTGAPDAAASQERGVVAKGGPVSLATSSDGETKPNEAPSGAKPAAGGVREIIAAAAKEANEDPNNMMLMSAIESSLNPSAVNGNAQGLNQFMPGSWGDTMKKAGSKYGLKGNESRTDARANTLMGAEYLKQNMKGLEQVRPNPTFTDGYMAHFLGLGNARKFFKASPDTIATSLLPGLANNPTNAKLFYEGNRALTTAEMYSKIEKKIADKAKEFNIPYTPKGLGGNTVGQTTVTGSGAPSGNSIPDVTSTASFTVPSSAVAVPTTVTGSRATVTPAAEKSNPPITMPSYRLDPVMQAVTQGNNSSASETTSEVQKSNVYLDSINRAILEKMVPALMSIDKAMQAMGGKMEGKEEAEETGPAPTTRTAQSNPLVMPTSASSFDNRRIL